MVAGTVYGVVLNDGPERVRLAPQFDAPPYGKPPVAPVLYIKSHNCFSGDGAAITLDGLERIEAAATIGLIFDRDLRNVSSEEATSAIAAACLVIDVTEPNDSYYRPSVRQRCRDGFLPIGRCAPFDAALLQGDIVTLVDGAEAHRWSPKRLVRGPAALIAEISAYMTLAAGDMLLIGLPADAPRLGAGHSIQVRAEGLPTLNAAVTA